MATRIAVRYISRRLLTGSKVLSEKEKAAGNVFIKGPKPSETPAGSVADVKPNGGASSDPIPKFCRYVCGGIGLTGFVAYSFWGVNPLLFMSAAEVARVVLPSKNKIEAAAPVVKFHSVVFVVLAAALYCILKLKAAEKVEGFEEKMGDDEASGSLGKKIYTDGMAVIKAIVFLPTSRARAEEKMAVGDGEAAGN